MDIPSKNSSREQLRVQEEVGTRITAPSLHSSFPPQLFYYFLNINFVFNANNPATLDYPAKCIELARRIGVAIGKLHDADIVHGDLTTSNMMIRGAIEGFYGDSRATPAANTTESESESQGHVVGEGELVEVVLIDFGLGAMQCVVEDKAVDLYVLERAFLSTHPGSEHLVAAVIDAYRLACRKGNAVLLKLEQVRQRGRKRDMLG